MCDYYRGSSSYEDAVRRQLTVLETTNLANTRAIHEMDFGFRDAFQTTNDILQENNDVMRAGFGATLAIGAEIGNNMMTGFGATLAMGAEIGNNIQANTNAIHAMATGLNCTIRESTYAIVASQTMLAQTFKQGFNAMNNMLGLGFSMFNSKLDAMTDRICSKLDELHNILNNPLLTASRELYRRALDEYKRGLYEEALESCTGAVEKNKTDFISWYLLGHIYLFGAGKFSNVVDVDKAEEAFFNAAKYIDYDLGKSDEADMLGSEIYYYLGYARLIKSNDLLVENNSAESVKKMEEAERASRESYRLSNKNLLALYEQAKEIHFLGREDDSLQLIEKLIRTDKNYALRFCNDKNFESLWDRIDNLIKTLRDELVNKLVQGFGSIRALGRKGNEFLADTIFLDEKQIRKFEQFYKSQLIEYWSLKKIVCGDFDSLAKEEKLYIEDVENCEEVIKNIRNERMSWKVKFNNVESNVELEIRQIESMLEKENDYFFVRDVYSSFCDNNNNSIIFKLISMMYWPLKAFDKKCGELKNDVKIIKSYIDTQQKWDKKKTELRDEHEIEITREWSEIHNSWKSHINVLRQQLSDIDFDEKSALQSELNIMESRLKEVSEYFGNLQGDDYYSICKKYKKLKKDNILQHHSSYFEWSLSELDKKLKVLRNVSSK